MLNKPDFTNKVAVITGGAGVLCGAISIALAEAGCRVAIVDLNLDAANRVAEGIRASGYEARGFQANCLDKASLEACHGEVLAAYGPCDFLINGAGGNNPKATTTDEYFDPEHMDIDGNQDFFKISADGFGFVFDLNVTAAFLTTQVFAKDMIGREGCSIMNISSMNAFTPLTKIPAYSAAKAAVSNFTKWLAVHFSKCNIRCNAIAPGFFLTNQNRGLLFTADGTPTPRTEKILKGTPMGRFGEAEELIGSVYFFLDENASGFITGVVLPIDGGFSSYSGV